MYCCDQLYRRYCKQEASDKGLPVNRHLSLHYPDDENVHKINYQQFLVGTELLVVPVLRKGKEEVRAYFPTAGEGSWRHVDQRGIRHAAVLRQRRTQLRGHSRGADRVPCSICKTWICCGREVCDERERTGRTVNEAATCSFHLNDVKETLLPTVLDEETCSY